MSVAALASPTPLPDQPPVPAPARLRVLVVDDHADIREPLAHWLQRQDFDVATAADARQMRHLLRHQPFDVIVLDIMLPDEDGLSLCREVAATLGTPVILLTARATPPERVTGLEAGADDYVVKPFDPAELAARIRTVRRREARAPRNAGAPAPGSRVSFDGWLFDMQRRELRDPQGKLVLLSDMEHQLLCALVAHPHQVLTRDRLLDLMHGDDAGVFDRAVDTQISRLRRKLELDPRRPRLIKTARSNGYLFVAQVQALAS
ncbi:response regulator transcription factor [Xenophilus arseniciresistens]|uniref:Response regulator transcription factor n=1 Tax=Xenophilus arseniciresistens TaxID=1283306 RepID=A0AAE3NBX6_9BURK|nr:response regulator transcription factor [Xenophilus arseniciresistens]MDA7418846.1 response regulator transcription factor [Xenophilus arseniciresistens]